MIGGWISELSWDSTLVKLSYLQREIGNGNIRPRVGITAGSIVDTYTYPTEGSAGQGLMWKFNVYLPGGTADGHAGKKRSVARLKGVGSS